MYANIVHVCTVCNASVGLAQACPNYLQGICFSCGFLDVTVSTHSTLCYSSSKIWLLSNIKQAWSGRFGHTCEYRECVHIGRNATVHSGWFSSCTISNPAVHWLLMPAPWCLHVAVQHSWWGLVLAKMSGLHLVGERRRHLPLLLPKPRPPLGTGKRYVRSRNKTSDALPQLFNHQLLPPLDNFSKWTPWNVSMQWVTLHNKFVCVQLHYTTYSVAISNEASMSKPHTSQLNCKFWYSRKSLVQTLWDQRAFR